MEETRSEEERRIERQDEEIGRSVKMVLAALEEIDERLSRLESRLPTSAAAADRLVGGVGEQERRHGSDGEGPAADARQVAAQ